MGGSKKEGERREKWPKGGNSLSVMEKRVEVCIGARLFRGQFLLGFEKFILGGVFGCMKHCVRGDFLLLIFIIIIYIYKY